MDKLITWHKKIVSQIRRNKLFQIAELCTAESMKVCHKTKQSLVTRS